MSQQTETHEVRGFTMLLGDLGEDETVDLQILSEALQCCWHSSSTNQLGH